MFIVPNGKKMENFTNKPTLFSKMYCSFFGHDYHVTKKVTQHVKEYKCCHCKKQLTTDGNGKLTEMTSTFKEINDILEHMYQRKLSKSRQRIFQTSAA